MKLNDKLKKKSIQRNNQCKNRNLKYKKNKSKFQWNKLLRRSNYIQLIPNTLKILSLLHLIL